MLHVSACKDAAIILRLETIENPTSFGRTQRLELIFTILRSQCCVPFIYGQTRQKDSELVKALMSSVVMDYSETQVISVNPREEVLEG